MYVVLKIVLWVIIFSGFQDNFILSLDFPSHVRTRRTREILQENDITLNTFLMKLDHFDVNNNSTWIMRFYSTNKYFKPGGPLFILNGGEQSINPYALMYTLMAEIAKDMGAHMVKMEHRYYGESIPDRYFSYHNVDQALGDMAYFIEEYKRLYPHLYNSKVVIFGTSYSGNLAIWMRLKYPNLVHSAVSSSAPVLAKMNFHEYWEEVFRLIGENCLNSIFRVQQELKNILNNPGGQRQVAGEFNLTGTVTFNTMQHIIQGIMIYMVNRNHCGSLEQICSALTNPQNNPYNVMLNIRRKQKTYLVSQSYYDSNNNQLAWFYQLCTEFGFFQSNYLAPFDAQIKACQSTFGPEFTPNVVANGVKRTNDIYGGKNIKVTRVISIHGTGDPWHILGLPPSQTLLSPVIYVEGSPHGKDVFPINYKCDGPQLIAAKKSVHSNLKSWLNDY